MKYKIIASKFKPKKIEILLICEAPPANGKTYFFQKIII